MRKSQKLHVKFSMMRWYDYESDRSSIRGRLWLARKGGTVPEHEPLEDRRATPVTHNTIIGADAVNIFWRCQLVAHESVVRPPQRGRLSVYWLQVTSAVNLRPAMAVPVQGRPRR